jgi:hypothetical protein
LSCFISSLVLTVDTDQVTLDGCQGPLARGTFSMSAVALSGQRLWMPRIEKQITFENVSSIRLQKERGAQPDGLHDKHRRKPLFGRSSGTGDLA